MIAGPVLDDIAGVLSHSERLRRVAEAERDAEVMAHRKTRTEYRAALVVLVVNAIIMSGLAVKYLRVVNLPKPRCLHAAPFVPSQLELAVTTEAPRQTV
jgi:hypothetical protein